MEGVLGDSVVGWGNKLLGRWEEISCILAEVMVGRHWWEGLLLWGFGEGSSGRVRGRNGGVAWESCLEVAY